MISITEQKKPFNTKLWVFVAAGVVVMIALTIGGFLFASTQATETYASQLTTVKSDVKSALEKATTALNETVKTGDKQKIAGALEELSTTLEAKLDVVPANSDILGVSLVSQAARGHREELLTKTRALVDRLKEASDLITYQENVFSVVVGVKDLTGNTQQEQEKLAASWQSALDQLRTITPPAPAADLHKQLTDSAAAINATLAELPGLFKDRNQAGFSTKQKELEGKIAGLQELKEPLKAIMTAQDKAIAEANIALMGIIE